jgi:general nucleoside transport system permease protein
LGLVTATVAAPRTMALAERRARTRQLILGVFYLVVAALIIVAFAVPVSGDDSSRLGLNLPGGAITIPDLTVPSALTAYVMAAAVAALGAIQLTRGFGTRWALGLGAVVALFVFAFLVWVAAGQSMNLVGVLQASVSRAVPIVFGALSGVLCERSGVVNIAIEGMLLGGAFTSAVVTSVTDSVWVGLAAAILTGAVLALVLAVLAIRYRVDQIIAGFFINIFVTGLTAFLAIRWLQDNRTELNTPEKFAPWNVPILSDIPILGPILFRHNIFVYILYGLIIAIHYGLFYTRWGLRVRAVGEHPRAADTVGINVAFVRYRNVILGGIVAGIGGAYFTIGSTGGFEDEMSAGKGFIGLAAMIFGGWTPIGSAAAGLVFGFADAIQGRLSILSIDIPSEFLLMLPYIVTIVVVAGVVGRARPPAADGKPYIKE